MYDITKADGFVMGRGIPRSETDEKPRCGNCKSWKNFVRSGDHRMGIAPNTMLGQCDLSPSTPKQWLYENVCCEEHKPCGTFTNVRFEQVMEDPSGKGRKACEALHTRYKKMYEEE